MTTAVQQAEAERRSAHQRLLEPRVEVGVRGHVQQELEQAWQQHVDATRHPEEDRRPERSGGAGGAGRRRSSPGPGGSEAAPEGRQHLQAAALLGGVGELQVAQEHPVQAPQVSADGHAHPAHDTASGRRPGRRPPPRVQATHLSTYAGRAAA